MKSPFVVALLWMLTAAPLFAWDVFGDITVHSVSWSEIRRDSLGNVYVSLKADVSSYGPRGQIFVTLAGKDSSGYEIENIILPPTVFEPKNNKSLTTVKLVRLQEYNRIKEWVVKSVEKYK